MFLKKSTGINVAFLLVDSTDFITPETSITTTSITLKLRKAGATSFSTISRTITEVGEGWYEATLTTTDTNTLGGLWVKAEYTGCAPWNDDHQVTTVIPGEQDFAITITDAERIAAVTLSMPVGDVRAHADADSTAMAATSGTGVKILANAVLAITGASSIVSTVATVKREDDSTTAFTRTATAAGAGSEFIGSLV